MIEKKNNFPSRNLYLQSNFYYYDLIETEKIKIII